MRNLCRILLVAVAFLFAASTAHAEESEAERLYKEGAEAYFQGEYAQAIIKFKRGNELDPNPMFLYNLALAYSKLGNVEEAESHAARAHKQGLPPQFADKNAARLLAFRMQLKSTELAKPVEVAVEEGTCEADTDCQGGEVCDLQSSQCVAVSSTPTESGSGLSGLGWAGIGAIAGGSGLILGAVIIDLGLSSDIDEYDRLVADGQTDEAESLKSDIEGSQSTGQILLFAGVGVATVGAALLIYDLMFASDSESTSAFYPTFDKDSAGVGFITTF